MPGIFNFSPDPLLLLWYILHIIKCYLYNKGKIMSHLFLKTLAVYA